MNAIKKLVMFLVNIIVPITDDQFNLFQDRATSYLSTNKLRLTLDSANVGQLLVYQGLWNPLFIKIKDPATRTPALVEEKNDLRLAYEELLRKVIGQAKKSNALTGTDRTELNLPDPNEPRTRIDAPVIAPVLTLNAIKHLEHVIRIKNPENPSLNKRPAGVALTEVFSYAGLTPPTDINLYKSCGRTGRFLFRVTYNLDDVGKTIWYIARYYSPRGEQGPPSEPVSGAVA